MTVSGILVSVRWTHPACITDVYCHESFILTGNTSTCLFRINIFCSVPLSLRSSAYWRPRAHRGHSHLVKFYNWCICRSQASIAPVTHSLLWSDLLRQLRWWRNLGFSLINVNVAHLGVHMACWKTECKPRWDYLQTVEAYCDINLITNKWHC